MKVGGRVKSADTGPETVGKVSKRQSRGRSPNGPCGKEIHEKIVGLDFLYCIIR